MPDADLTLLVIAGAALIGMVLAVFVFAITARRFVSSEQDGGSAAPAGRQPDATRGSRAERDRRSGDHVDFPLTVNGTVIPCDRRRGG